MKKLFSILILPLFIMSCQKAQPPDSVATSNSNIMNTYYENWRKEWEIEATRKLIAREISGPSIQEGDKEANLESLKALVSAPVSDALWAQFIYQKIHENNQKSWDDRIHGYEYLAIGACHRFKWSIREVLAEYDPREADENNLTNYFILPEAVLPRLKNYKK